MKTNKSPTTREHRDQVQVCLFNDRFIICTSPIVSLTTEIKCNCAMKEHIFLFLIERTNGEKNNTA